MHTTILTPCRPLLREESTDTPQTGSGDGTGTPPPAETPPPDNATQSTPPADDVDFGFEAATEQPDGQQPADGTEAAEYALELPEDFEASDDFKTIITERAKSAGLDGKAAGQYVASVVAAVQASEAEALKQSTQDLKEAWGKDFQPRMQAVRAFGADLQKRSGLTAEDFAPLQSPKGYKLLHALMTATGGDRMTKGTTTQEPPAVEAKRMLTDPSHPLYAALQDPQNPQFAAANQRYNQLVGLV
ncbi:hypothetical protein ICN84_07830 [Akkermansia glycaniphila]|uniref:hypothetical protein n=1 Tax=Akkermansia glycaniphila TaxID=1679444 RepID=UPI001C0124B3|nr:hypothetical protein [Akkermansia glycaniphila]MBT9449982.1 hypothetical protein [Akkermansia glycaniphila]